MNTYNPKLPDFFPVGHCHHADFLKQSPPLTSAQYKEFMRYDLTQIKEAGFNAHNMEFGWLDMEYREDTWDFSRTDAVFELCQELDLPVFAWMFADLTPRWLIRKHPEVRAVNATGYHSETHSFGHPLARDRIRVNAIAPGYFETEMNSEFFSGEAGRRLLARVPAERLGKLAELATQLRKSVTGFRLPGSMMTGLTGEFPALKPDEPPAVAEPGADRIRRIGSLAG